MSIPMESAEQTARVEEASRQMAHLAWHGDTLHHWHVGVTALDFTYDGRLTRTETITKLYGVPVFRLLRMDRNEIRAVPTSQCSCHWEHSPDWPDRETTIP